ncbi:MAG: glycosyltransferase family 4 protein [bacterium]
MADLTVCYFGTYSRGEEYARNNAIIGGLKKNGVEVIPCQTDVWPTHEEKMASLDKGMLSQGWAYFRAYLKLVRKYLSVPDHQFLCVGYIGHVDMFPARLLGWLRRKPVVFDAFFSLYDTVVLDRGLYPPGSLRARVLKEADRWSCRLADLVLLDTWEHVDYFCREFNLPRSKFLAVPLGTDEENFYPRGEPAEDGVLDVISYSSYIPLHGIDVQLDAAALLKDEPDIRFTFVGKGQLYLEMRERADKAGLDNVRFIEWIPHGELVELIAGSDVCLGIFGRTEKASRVIPYKAYEALAMQKPLITGDSPAARELLQDGEHVLLSPMGDPDTLSEKIKLLREAELRRRIARKGHQVFSEHATSEAIAGRILDELQTRWPDRGGK